jgi:transcriptional regulator with XRE-family HTH domain
VTGVGDAFDEALLDLGANCKRQRQRQGLNVAELERLSGVKALTIWHIERGDAANPTLRTLCKLAHGLDCTLFDLLAAQGRKE